MTKVVGLDDFGVDFQVTVTIQCHLIVQVNKLPRIFQLPTADCDWTFGRGILCKDVCLLVFNFESYGTFSLAEFVVCCVVLMFM